MWCECQNCGRAYDDAKQWTICPHSPLGHAIDDLCPKCDTLRSVHGPCRHQIKKPLTSLTRNHPKTPEGKYLVKRRDGSVPPWPSFVLGAADPIAEVALRAYHAEVVRIIKDEPKEAEVLGLTIEFADDLLRWCDTFRHYREEHGKGDPGMGPHRIDDPVTIAEMRKGLSA